MLLRKFIRFAASFGIIGPHDGHEAELLIAKKKPIGIFGVWESDCAENSDSLKFSAEDDETMRLDACVERGMLIKRTVHGKIGEDGLRPVMHIYAQPSCKADLKALSDYHEAVLQQKPQEEWPTLEKGIGEMLGYTHKDEDMYVSRGQNFGLLTRVFLTASHPIRKAARRADLLSEHTPDIP